MHPEALPAAALYVPVGQGEHGPSAGPKKPGAQVQFAVDVLPAGAWKLGGQSKHMNRGPAGSEYLPGSHVMHVESEVAPA